MQKYLVPRNRSPLIRVRLDDHGSAVWQKIDGRRTVYDIVESLASHFDGDDKYELQISIFINHLRQEGYIRMLSEPAP
jgi:hypothetical protein